MDPCIHGSMNPWINGSIDHRSMDPWNHDPWFHGSMHPWLHESMDLRSVKPWVRGFVDPWIMDTWIYGSMGFMDPFSMDPCIHGPWIHDPCIHIISMYRCLSTPTISKSMCKCMRLTASHILGPLSNINITIAVCKPAFALCTIGAPSALVDCTVRPAPKLSKRGRVVKMQQNATVFFAMWLSSYSCLCGILQ